MVDQIDNPDDLSKCRSRSAVARHPNSRVRIGAIQLRITARPGGHGIKSGIDGVMAASKRSRSKVETESGTGDKEFPVTSLTAAKLAWSGSGEAHLVWPASMPVDDPQH